MKTKGVQYVLKNIWVYKDQTNIKENIGKEIKCSVPLC